MGSHGEPGSPLCLQILTQSSAQSMERGADCEVLLLCHSASPNPAGWDEFSCSASPPPPSLLSHSPTFSSPSIRMCNLRGRRDHFCFLPVPLLCSLPLSSSALPLSFSLSLSPALFSLPLATFHTHFKPTFSELKYCTHRRKSRAACGSTHCDYIIKGKSIRETIKEEVLMWRTISGSSLYCLVRRVPSVAFCF